MLNSRPITKAQVKSIHVALSRQGVDDELYRLMLDNLFKVSSCKELTRKQASTLLVRLGRNMAVKQANARPIARKRPPVKVKDGNNVITLASPAQHNLIDNLVSEIRWSSANGFDAWLKKNMGLEKIRTGQDATKVIQGLKGIKRHGV